MKNKALLITLAAAAALAGCDTKPEVVTGDGPYDPQANATANAAPVELPPSIVASHKYRCKDNSVLSIDWLSNGTKNSANVTPQGGSLVSLAQAEVDGDYTAEGATLKGKPADAAVTYNGQSCKK
jgi:hypothetical protein